MTPLADPVCYKNHRFPGEIISHGVWLYYRFTLSYRDVGYPLSPGHHAPSITCRDGLTTLPWHR